MFPAENESVNSKTCFPWLWQPNRTYHDSLGVPRLGQCLRLGRNNCVRLAAAGAWMHVAPAGTAATAGSRKAGFTVPARRVSHCVIEVEAPWRALQCLTPDAMQLADPHWTLQRYPSAVWEAGAAAAKEGDIAPLKLLSLDVQMGTRDGADRCPVNPVDLVSGKQRMLPVHSG